MPRTREEDALEQFFATAQPTDHERILTVFGELGFDEWQMGGGMTAFGINLTDDDGLQLGHVLVTGTESEVAPVSMGELLDVGFYRDDVECSEAEEFRSGLSVEESVAFIHSLDENVAPAEEDEDDEEEFDDLDDEAAAERYYQSTLVDRKCQGCGRHFLGRPDHGFCDSCADIRERGGELPNAYD
jgi:hypothetical protein